VKTTSNFKKVVYLLLLSLTVIFAVSCSSETEGHEEHHPTFSVTHPIYKDTVITKEYVCQIHAISHIELRAQERGFLERIYIDEGDFVKKGQALFQIMPNLYQAEFERASAEVHYAEIEYKNTKLLADSNIVSSNQLALMEAKLDKAKAELSMAEVHLSFTEIKAPFDGIIDRFHVRLGSLIEEGELLTNLSDNSEMWVYFNVPEAEYLDFKMKFKTDSLAEVKLMMANNELFYHNGVVETIEADFNNETGNIAFRATFPNAEGLLRHGETGNILMTTPLKHALIIPQKASFEILDKKYVFIVDENDLLVTRQIQIASELPHLYIISSGLDVNDKILLDGLRKVRAGDKIKYVFEDPETVISGLELYAE
jgi:membrane fusion protein (multidrug efflux system)